MRFRVSHSTQYKYAGRVSHCYNLANVVPRDTERQRCLSNSVTVMPQPAVTHKRTDYFGNKAYHFEIQKPHTELIITAVSEIQINDRDRELGLDLGASYGQMLERLSTANAKENIVAREFILNSPMIECSDTLADYARPSFHPDRSLKSCVSDLTTHQYSRNADLVIHECFVSAPDMMTKMKFTPESALMVGTQVHTAPEAFGKIMSAVKPRMAVAYHFFNDFDTSHSVYERIRQTYDGPLSLSEDLMVWNVTKDEVRTRLAVVDDHTWAPPTTRKPQLPDIQDRKDFAKKVGVNSLEFSKFISDGVWNVDDVLRLVYKEVSESAGRTIPYPKGE